MPILDDIMFTSLIDILNAHDSTLLREALKELSEFSTPTHDGLIIIWCSEIPTSQSLPSSVVCIALCEFVLKPSVWR